jgi:hypothetical protein
MAKESPFDEEFTPEEEAALNDTTVPPAEEGGEGSVEEAIAAAGQAKTTEAPPEPAPAKAPEPKAGEEPQPKPAEVPPVDQAAAEAAEFAAFLEKNKGKTPEELARLAFQQTKRATKEAATARQVKTKVGAVAQRVRAAAESREKIASTVPELKEKFRARLAEDPDAAVAELFDGLVDSKLSEADAAVQSARIDDAITFADTYIPEFGQNWPQMHELANELGFKDEEVNAIDDGRTLVALYLANIAGRLMKAGIIDRLGNIQNIPQIEPTPLDPRLSAPDPQPTLGGGRPKPGGTQSLEEQLNAIAQMSDPELNQFEKDHPGVIDELLKAAA